MSEAINLHALTEVNAALLTEMKQLDSVDDITKFWKSSDKKTVESQVGLIKEFVSDTNCTGTPCPKGFIVKRHNNVTSFSSNLPEDMCEQFVYTQLTLELQNASRRDYTEVNKLHTRYYSYFNQLYRFLKKRNNSRCFGGSSIHQKSAPVLYTIRLKLTCTFK